MSDERESLWWASDIHRTIAIAFDRLDSISGRLPISDQVACADELDLGFMWDRHGYVELGGGDA